MEQTTADARGRVGLPPTTPPIEAAATEQKNDDYDDKKRGHVHGFSFVVQSVSRGILAPLAVSKALKADNIGKLRPVRLFDLGGGRASNYLTAPVANTRR